MWSCDTIQIFHQMSRNVEEKKKATPFGEKKTIQVNKINHTLDFILNEKCLRI